MTTIAVDVDQLLAATPVDDAPLEDHEPPSLDEHLTEHCQGITKAGTRCKGTLGLVDGLCSIHRGLIDHRAAQRAQKAAQAAARADQQATLRNEATRNQMTLKQRLAARAAEEAEAIVDALFAPLHDMDLLDEEGKLVRAGAGTMEKQRAAQGILDRLIGRPGEGLGAVEQAPEPRTLEEIVGAWMAADAAHEVGQVPPPLDEPSS